MSDIDLPPEIEFHEDIRLFIYRPRGLLDEVEVSRAVNVLSDLEKKVNHPFNRFSDTSEIDRVELNYRYVIQVSLYRVLSYGDRPPVKSAILAPDFDHWPLFPIARHNHQGLPNQCANISRTRRRCEMARCPAGTTG